MVTHGGSHSQTLLQLSVNFLTKRGEEKREGNKKEKERGRPQSPDQAKGRQGQDKGPQGGEKRKNHLRSGQAMAGSGQVFTHRPNRA